MKEAMDEVSKKTTSHHQRRRRQLMERDGVKRCIDGIQWGYVFRCYLCRNEFPPDELEIEHKVPKSRGGSDHLDNLGLACTDCNSEKANMTEEEYKEYRQLKARYAPIVESVNPAYLGRNKPRKIRGLTHALSDHWPDEQDQDAK